MFNEIELFAVLVCTFHKEPIETSEFDPLYLKNYFELFRSLKKLEA